MIITQSHDEHLKGINKLYKDVAVSNVSFKCIFGVSHLATYIFDRSFGVPHTCIFLFFYNKPELGVGIDPGMALTPLPSSIGWGLKSSFDA